MIGSSFDDLTNFGVDLKLISKLTQSLQINFFCCLETHLIDFYAPLHNKTKTC